MLQLTAMIKEFKKVYKQILRLVDITGLLVAEQIKTGSALQTSAVCLCDYALSCVLIILSYREVKLTTWLLTSNGRIIKGKEHANASEQFWFNI